MLATSTGQVWAGYFDEGIYGNYGWGRADCEEPVGAYGIVRFSPALEPDWHYPKYTEVGPWDAISDCCALNVDDTSTWACYDSDFPVVRIRDDAVTGWHNDITGASALVVAGSRVALFGGYGPDHDRLALAELDADRARQDGEYRVVLPDGEPLAPGTQVIGPGIAPALPRRQRLVPARRQRHPAITTRLASRGDRAAHDTAQGRAVTVLRQIAGGGSVAGTSR